MNDFMARWVLTAGILCLLPDEATYISSFLQLALLFALLPLSTSMLLCGGSVCGDPANVSHMTAWHRAAPVVDRLRLHTNVGRSSHDVGRPRL